MIKVALLTHIQSEEISGKKYNDSVYFNPIIDASGDFVISVEEIRDTTVEEFMWVKSLPLIDYTPIEITQENG